MRNGRVVALVVAGLFILSVGRLAVLDHRGPAHSEVELRGHEPATIYLPGEGNPFYQVFPPPPEKRAPAVVLVHGFMSDRQLMSILARRIAQNGYAVIAIDVSGHGSNRNPFPIDFGGGEPMQQDIRRAVEFMRSDPFVDGSRIVVMGHSMGAGMAIDYATRDPNLKGSVMISGGFRLAGPGRPKNALFIFAQRDPEFISAVSKEIAAHLAGVPTIELGKTYGAFDQGNAVEAIQVPGVDHVQIVSSKEAATTIVKWLDSTFGTVRTAAINVDDPRTTMAGIASILFLIVLVALGRACGMIAPEWTNWTKEPGQWSGLLILGAALVAAMPLIAMITPMSFVPLVVGDVQTSWLVAASVMTIGALAWMHRLEWTRVRDGLGATIFAAAIAIAAIYFCEVAMTVTFHRMSLTPERMLVWILVTILMLPFWLSFEWMLRRGGMLTSTAYAIAGKVLILVLMAAGAGLDILPMVTFLILPSLVLVFVMIEIFAASAYSTSRNAVLIAIVESAWFALTMAATNPITFML
jgi:dienelactone hydrolase